MITLIQNFTKILRRFMSLFNDNKKSDLKTISLTFRDFFFRIKLIAKIPNQNTFLHIFQSIISLLKTKMSLISLFINELSEILDLASN